MCEPDAGNGADELAYDVDASHRPWQLASDGEGETDGGIEVRPRNRTERQNENAEDGARRQRVAQERDRIVSARQFECHHARSDDGGEQEGRSQTFRGSASGERVGRQVSARAFGVAPCMRPISRSSARNETASSLSIGNDANAPILRESIRHVSLKASMIWVGEPFTAAGSGMPQCAVIVLPGHTGQVSPAASSQTVKMKSNSGAPGSANSSHDFERRPAVS